MEPKIPNLKRENITDQIYSTLKKLILSGQWSVGTRIPSETELANQFGVSRMSVRMALQRLQVMGLIDVRVGDGTFVRELSIGEYISEIGEFILRDKDLYEIAQFRKTFELEALRLAMEQYSPDQLSLLEGILNRLLEAVRQDDNDRFIEEDFRFHRYIGTMSGNSIFETLYDLSSALMVQYYKENRQISPIKSESDLQKEDHALLFGAIRDRDFDRAKRIYAGLIDYAIERKNHPQ